MTTNFVLIDYENVQPKELALLRGSHFKVKLFLVASQAKIPVALAAALHALGMNAEYVLLESRAPMLSISTLPTTPTTSAYSSSKIPRRDFTSFLRTLALIR